MRVSKKKSGLYKRSSPQRTVFLYILAAFFMLIFGAFLLNTQKSNISSFLRQLMVREYTISYDGAMFTPEFVVIHLGDKVTVENSSLKAMEIAAGRHENHKTLNGFQEKIVGSKEEYTFTPLESGVFDLHDHFNPKNLGTLIIDR